MIFFHNALVVMTPSGCKFQLINSNYFIQSIFKASVMQQVKVVTEQNQDALWLWSFKLA